MSSNPDGFLTPSQVAERLGIPYHRAWSWCGGGKFGTPQRLRGRVFVEAARVEAYARGRALEHASESAVAAAASAVAPPTGLHETLLRMHAIGRAMAALQLEYDGRLESLEGDAREAEQAGATERALELRSIADEMRRVTYGVDVSTGQFVLGMRQANGEIALAQPEQPV